MSPQGHLEGVTSAHLGAFGSGGSHPHWSEYWEEEWPCPHGLQTGLSMEQTARREPFSVVFSIAGGGGGHVLWTDIPRPGVPAPVPALQTEPRAGVAATLLAAQPDQCPAGFLCPSGSLPLASMAQGQSAAPGRVGSVSPQNMWKPRLCHSAKSVLDQSPGGRGGPFPLGKHVHLRAQVARPTVTQQGPSVPLLAPASSSGFFSGVWGRDGPSVAF